MRLLKTTAIAAALFCGASAASAATVDFTDEGEYGIASGSTVTFDGVTMTLSAKGGDPYLDGFGSSDAGLKGPGGLGVCSDISSGDCDPSSDDNIDELAEMLTIEVGASQSIRNMVFGNHGDDISGGSLYVDGVNMSFADASAMTFFGSVTVSYLDTQFYVQAMDVVPVPAAGFLLLGGLGGLAAMKRRKKA